MLKVALLLLLLAPSAAAQAPKLVPSKAMTQDVEVLYGDPDAVGKPFVMRIRELPGGIIPPHRHPVDEHITVIEGTLWFATGYEKFDRSVLQELKAGSYAFIPKGTTMFGMTPEAAVVQVHGIGPFHIHWRAGEGWWERDKTMDSPDAAGIFTHFKKGDLVTGARGRGTVKQGYYSGEILQYLVEREDGSLYMALPEEIRRVADKH